MNKSIQLLRGISIVYILILHSTFMWPVKLQNIYFNFFDTASGVELFFCIAGYFSAKKIYSYQNYTFQSFINYVINRFKRLSPLLYFWATVMFLWGVMADPIKWGTPNFLYCRLIGTFLYVRNFQEVVTPNAFGYFWAVSLEMQYFCMISFLMFILKRNHTIYLLIFLFIIFSFIRPGLLQSPYFRIDAMILGSLLYELNFKFNDVDLQNNYINKNKIFELFLFIMLLLCLGSSLLVLKDYNSLKFSATAFISFILTFLAVRKSGIVSFKIKIIDLFFEKIGDYSFSIYVCHIITWWIGGDILRCFYPNCLKIYEFLFSMVLMVICSFFSKKYIENIFR